MDTGTDDPRAAMLTRVRSSLSRAETRARRLRSQNARLIYSSLIASAVATVLAGLTAALGPLAGTGPRAWSVTCGVIAVFTAMAGVLSGIHQKLSVPEQLANAVTCAGRLRALEVALTVTMRDPTEVAREYEEVTARHPDLFL